MSTAGTVARSGATGRPSTARARAVSTTASPPGISRCRRRTRTTAWTAEHSQATSSAPLAAAISAALASAPPFPGPTAGSTRGANAASAARSAAVCTAASAPMSTAATPASRTNPASDNPMRVAPPRSPGRDPDASTDAGATRRFRSPGTSLLDPFLVEAARADGGFIDRPGSAVARPGLAVIRPGSGVVRLASRMGQLGPGVVLARGRRPRWR